MKNWLLIFILFPFFIMAQVISKPKKIKVLFIGNSYTYYNNLPQLVKDIALANNDTLIFDSNTPGGYTLNQHFNDVNTKSKISSTAWDYVVVQAQSQEPSFSPSQVMQQTYPYAKKLDSLIKLNNLCTTTIFYETWGRKFGDASNCGSYPPVCTYTGMQNRLRSSYKLFADSVGGAMSPVGESFRKSIALNPTLELYDQDQSHPSINGSYLAACTFYEVLFQKSVLNNGYIPGITTPSLAPFLQQVAHTVVNDSLNVWNLGVNVPWANYTQTLVTPSSFQFQSVAPTLINKWYFGDGTTSNLASPAHTYSASGTYVVSHTVRTSCKKDSVYKTLVLANTTAINEQSITNELKVYPNPSSHSFTIDVKNANEIWIYNSMGALVKHQIIIANETTITISDLASGIYCVSISEKNNKQTNIKILKE
jgi:PKD repeat protein